MPTNLFDFGAVKSARLSRMSDAELAAEVGVPADWTPLVRAGIKAKWPPERLERLKSETIASLASAWGMSMATIFQMRRAMGVKHVVRHRRAEREPQQNRKKRSSLEWTSKIEARLGREPDSAIAADLGCTRAAIQLRRKKLDIKPQCKAKWTSEALARLGKEPDIDLAAQLGVAPHTVRVRREGLNLAVFVPPVRPTPWTPEVVARLGQEPDAAIGASIGLPQPVVNLHRRRLGIPPFHPRYLAVDRLIRMSEMWFDGLTIGEIAEAMGNNSQTIRHHLHRHPDMFPSRPKPIRHRNSDLAVRHMLSVLADSA